MKECFLKNVILNYTPPAVYHVFDFQLLNLNLDLHLFRYAMAKCICFSTIILMAQKKIWVRYSSVLPNISVCACECVQVFPQILQIVLLLLVVTFITLNNPLQTLSSFVKCECFGLGKWTDSQQRAPVPSAGHLCPAGQTQWKRSVGVHFAIVGSQFVLRGPRVSLLGSSVSCFAHHVCSCFVNRPAVTSGQPLATEATQSTYFSMVSAYISNWILPDCYYFPASPTVVTLLCSFCILSSPPSSNHCSQWESALCLLSVFFSITWNQMRALHPQVGRKNGKIRLL